jgi:hypothetical protein
MALASADIHSYRLSHPEPYERNIGRIVLEILRLFQERFPDAESSACVTELAMASDRWSAAHAVFGEIRGRAQAAAEVRDAVRCAQYDFEELCCKAMYNAATSADDEFDSSSPFFVAGAALKLARAVGLPVEVIVDLLTPAA